MPNGINLHYEANPRKPMDEFEIYCFELFNSRTFEDKDALLLCSRLFDEKFFKATSRAERLQIPKFQVVLEGATAGGWIDVRTIDLNKPDGYDCLLNAIQLAR